MGLGRSPEMFHCYCGECQLASQPAWRATFLPEQPSRGGWKSRWGHKSHSTPRHSIVLRSGDVASTFHLLSTFLPPPRGRPPGTAPEADPQADPLEHRRHFPPPRPRAVPGHTQSAQRASVSTEGSDPCQRLMWCVGIAQYRIISYDFCSTGSHNFPPSPGALTLPNAQCMD